MTDQQALWQQMCLADGLDPAKRLAARQAVLAHPEALTATVYRADEDDTEAEERDLGDVKVLVQGAYQLPAHWSAAEKNDYLAGNEENELTMASIECEAGPESGDYFLVDVGDYLACVDASGKVSMYFVHDYEEDDNGRRCVLIEDQFDDL